MRISDWSSDVCSSDLRRLDSSRPRASGGIRPRLHEEIWREAAGLFRAVGGCPSRHPAGENAEGLESGMEDRADRKAKPRMEPPVRRHHPLKGELSGMAAFRMGPTFSVMSTKENRQDRKSTRLNSSH